MVYIVGDVHGWNDIHKLIHLKMQTKFNKCDKIILLGDTAIYFNPNNPDYTDRLLDFYKSFNIDILVVGGNHDNYDYFDNLKRVRKFGSKVGLISDHIYYLERGEIYTINKKKYFVFGGGNSIDKDIRTPGKDWWEHENPTQEDKDRALKNLEKHEYKVDYVLSHTSPTRITFRLLLGKVRAIYPDETSDFLDDIMGKIEYTKWFMGHHHTDKQYVYLSVAKNRSNNTIEHVNELREIPFQSNTPQIKSHSVVKRLYILYDKIITV